MVVAALDVVTLAADAVARGLVDRSLTPAACPALGYCYALGPVLRESRPAGAGRPGHRQAEPCTLMVGVPELMILTVSVLLAALRTSTETVPAGRM